MKLLYLAALPFLGCLLLVSLVANLVFSEAT